MSSKYEAEAELRRHWGANYDKHLDNAVDVFDAMPEETRKRINQNDPAHIQALAAMKDPAYLDQKNPNHERISGFVRTHFDRLHGDDEIIL